MVLHVGHDPRGSWRAHRPDQQDGLLDLKQLDGVVVARLGLVHVVFAHELHVVAVHAAPHVDVAECCQQTLTQLHTQVGVGPAEWRGLAKLEHFHVI